jgi:hypothetical protein
MVSPGLGINTAGALTRINAMGGGTELDATKAKGKRGFKSMWAR